MLTVISGKLNTAFRILLLCLPGQQTALQICASPTCANNKKQIEPYLLCAEGWAQTVCSKGFQAGSALAVFYLASAA